LKIKNANKLEKLLIKDIQKRAELGILDDNEYMYETVVNQLPGYVHTHEVSEDAAHDMDTITMWDNGISDFETGLAVGQALKKGEEVFSVCIGPDDFEDGVDVEWYHNCCFWFVAKSESDLVEKCKAKIDEFLDKDRAENGLLALG
jgi:hypothetical protein